MTDTTTKSCAEEVWNAFSHHVCGRKITPKDPEGKLCGLHLAAKVRRAQKDAELKAAMERGREIDAEARRIEQELREHGIKATVGTVGSYPAKALTGNVTISLEDLRTLIAGQRFDNHETETPK